MNIPMQYVEHVYVYGSMVDRRKVFSHISSRDYCQRSLPSLISGTPKAGFESAYKLISGSDE